MGRLAYFTGGAFVGSLMILNYVYENEALNEQVREDLLKKQRI